MTNDLPEKTRKLLKQLNYFIAHVVIYFFTNILLVILAFTADKNSWWIFLLMFFWATILIYHGLKVYGIDLVKPPSNRSRAYFN